MGGQSQRRFERIIEQLVEEFYKKVGERAARHFLPLLEKGILKGIILAGPGYAKIDFYKGGYLDYRLQKLVTKDMVDVAYQGDQGLKEVVMKASSVIQAQAYRESTEALEEFKLHLAKSLGTVVYTRKEVERAITMGAVKTLLAHEDLEDLDKWRELCKHYGCKFIVIPSSLPESKWFLETFEGIAGILRYKV
jgi:peptide chain release factor subunit 1